MSSKSKVFSNFYMRFTNSSNSEKGDAFSLRIHQAPFLLVRISKFTGFFLGRSETADKLFNKIPVLNLFVSFLSGNAQLILRSPDHALVIPNKEENADTEVVYDLIVVGSGPGGSIAALRGAEAGKQVLIVESGYSFAESSIEHHSLFQTNKQFRNGGLNFIWGFKPVLFAEGMTLGGGSEVNSGLYHRLEGERRKQILAAVGASEDEWAELERLVEEEISVQGSPGGVKPDHGLVLGAELHGLITKEIPRWRKYEPVEQHQGMQVTYLNKARALGAKITVETAVEKLRPKSEHIEVFTANHLGKNVLKAREVVLAAGTLETPRILNRSRLSGASFPLNLHPMLRAVGAQEKEINDGDLFPSWQAWDSDLRYKYGYSVSTFPYLSATLTSLGESRVFSENELAHMAAYFASFALEDSSIKLKKIGNRLLPTLKFGKSDKKSIQEASKHLVELLKAGGATEVWPKKGISPVTTVHLFGSLPVGKSPLITNDARLQQEFRIRISDGSLMPHAPWGNPQGPIMVLCELMARRVSRAQKSAP
jgi:choline dehydrogenase-like flavoprotein